MATVREGVMRRPEPDYSRRGEVIRLEPDITEEDLIIELLKVRMKQLGTLTGPEVLISDDCDLHTR